MPANQMISVRAEKTTRQEAPGRAECDRARLTSSDLPPAALLRGTDSRGCPNVHPTKLTRAIGSTRSSGREWL
jgi:hypothetical protein